MLYAVIMAGGVGSRFWPRSRQATPKQFLRFAGDRSLIQTTADRLVPIVPPERILVVTHARYAEQTQQQLPDVPAENILAEPIARNTAPCIAFAAAHLAARDPHATMLVLPADHVVRNQRSFEQVVAEAERQAQTPGALVTIGIEPTHPETGYGYIQYDADDEQPDVPRARPVLTFAEKPDLATAERFVDSGDFVWNSGMFAWRVDSIRSALETHVADVARAFNPIAEAADRAQNDEAVVQAYADCPNISIDYGVMERAANVWCVPASFGWNDVGDWRAFADLQKTDDAGNALEGDVIVHASARCCVEAGDRTVALVGVNDLIVVDTPDALLVCHRDAAQQVKSIVNHLSLNDRDDVI
jgi:mannose-1-phosphate guanylyltransferase